MATFYLGVGTGSGDRLDLSDETNYVVLSSGFRVDDDGADRRFQYVTLPMLVRGSSKDDLLNARRAILTKLNQATLGARGVTMHERVMLGVQLNNADTMVWWHVTEGGITEPGGWNAVHGNVIGYESEPMVLTLRVRKGAYGTPIEDAPVTVAGDDPVLYRPAIPGDLPAYVELVVTDESTNSVVLSGMGIGARSALDLDDGDFEPFQSVTTDGIGGVVEDEDDADHFGDDYVTATTGLTWQTMCYVKPTADIFKAEYDLWLRVRDSSAYLDAPAGLSATGVPGASMRQQVAGTGEKTGNRTITLTTPTITGNTLVLKVFAVQQTSGTPSVTSVPSGFTLVESDSDATKLIALYIYPNAPGASGDLIVGLSGQGDAGVYLEEWTGLTSSPVDVTASNTVAGSTSHPTGTTSATDQADALAMTMHLSGTRDPVTYTDTYARLIRERMAQLVGFVTYYAQGFSYYRRLSSIGTQSATMTTDDSHSSVNLIAVFKTVAGGQLTGDTYAYRVSALAADGAQSVASTTATVYHATASGNATQLEWPESTSPAVVGYRVYARKGTGSWVYFDTGSTIPAFLHTTMSGPDGTADPPDTSASTADIRIGLAIGPRGRITHYSEPVRPAKANGVWEWLRVGSEMLSPLSVPLSVAQPDPRIVVQIKHPTQGREVAVDVVAFVPADEMWFEVDVRGMDINGRREWVLGTNQGGQSYAFVRDPNDDTDVSGAFSDGVLAVGPGDSKLLFLFRDEDGAAVVGDVSVDVAMTIYPRYRWLAGST